MNKLLALSLGLLYPAIITAGITNVVDIAALSACGTGTVNGWKVSGIDSYADRTSIRLNGKDESLISPVFDTPIIEILMKVKSSSRSGRHLAIFPIANGSPVTGTWTNCDYSPNKDTYVPTSFHFSESDHITAFRIAFDDPDNGDTGWGISEMSVVTVDAPYLRRPGNVVIDAIGPTRARVKWTAEPPAASNIISICEICNRQASGNILYNYDFGLCVNNGTSDSQDKSADISAKYPELSGERIYYPAATSGVVRISTGSANGRLTHSGYSDYENMTLEISARRYPGDRCRTLYAYYFNELHDPVTIGTMPVSDEIAVGHIPLTGTPNGTSINLGNLDGFKSDRRYLVDRISFLDDFRPATSTTNVIFGITVPNDGEFHIGGLAPASEYTVTITSIDNNGRHSEPSSPVGFRTDRPGCGTKILFR